MSHQQQPNADQSDDHSDGFPPKPKRPLTVFNLFGKLERNYIVQSSQKRAPVSLESSTAEGGSTEGTTSESSVSAVDPYLELRPAKYRDIVLPHDWFKVGKNRSDRKFYQAHRVIAFKDLSKVVTDRWSKVDDETRTFLQTIYDRELAKYRIEMKEYVEMYGEDALESQKMVYKSRKADGDAARDSKGADSSKKPKATRPSPKDQTITALQHHPKTSTVSDIGNHTTQGSTKSACSSNAAASTQLHQLNNAYFASLNMNAHPSDVVNNRNQPHDDNRFNAGLHSQSDSFLDPSSSDLGLPLDPFYDMNSFNPTSVFNSMNNSSSKGQNNMAQSNAMRGDRPTVGTEVTVGQRQRGLLPPEIPTRNQPVGANPWQYVAQSDAASSIREAGPQFGLFDAQSAQNQQLMSHLRNSSQSLPLIAAQPSQNRMLFFHLQLGHFSQNPSSQSLPLVVAQPPQNQMTSNVQSAPRHFGQNLSNQAPSMLEAQQLQNQMVSDLQSQSLQWQLIAAHAQQIPTAASNTGYEGVDVRMRSNSDGSDSSGSILSDFLMDAENCQDTILLGEDLQKAFDSSDSSFLNA